MMFIRGFILLCLPLVTTAENYVFDLINNKDGIDKTNYVDQYMIKNSKSDNLIIWIPGYYDYFRHDHILNEIPFFSNINILPMYFDSWNISKFQPYKEDNFLDYFNGIDKILSTIDTTKYKNILLYGHSMGGLLATIYGHCGKYNHIFNGVILNDPYLKWHRRTFMSENIYLHPKSWSWEKTHWSFRENNPISWWHKSVRTEYLNQLDYLDEEYPNPAIHVTAGHMWAASQVMNFIKTSQKPLFGNIPTLLLMSGGIERFKLGLLRQKDLINTAPKISTNVERVAVNSAIHDVFFPNDRVDFQTLDHALKSFFNTLTPEKKLKIIRNLN